MTTTITLETHDWPVEVQTSDDLAFDASPYRRGHGFREEYEFVPAKTKRQFHITGSRSLRFRELPADATGLTDHYRGDTVCSGLSVGLPVSKAGDEPDENTSEEASSNG